jgi:hypothetical protein
MRFKGLDARIERLERGTKGGECEGCNRTTALRMARIMRQEDSAANYQPPANEDWTGTDLERCPVCGNPDPRMTIRYAREIAGV